METTRNRTLYHLTEYGAETIHFFSNKISPAIREDIDDFLKAVSYTHLDVYKRQIIG